MTTPIDVTNIRIETPRLILRSWQETDLEDFYEYARVDGVGQMAGWMPHRSPEESRAILESFIRNRKVFALELKENGKVIGSLGLENPNPVPEEAQTRQGREIGYVLSRDYWGRGLMPEAVQAVIDYAFTKLNYDWLTCAHFRRNSQSRRVIEKCGFSFFGESQFETRYDTLEPSCNYIIYNPKVR